MSDLDFSDTVVLQIVIRLCIDLIVTVNNFTVTVTVTEKMCIAYMINWQFVKCSPFSGKLTR